MVLVVVPRVEELTTWDSEALEFVKFPSVLVYEAVIGCGLPIVVP